MEHPIQVDGASREGSLRSKALRDKRSQGRLHQGAALLSRVLFCVRRAASTKFTVEAQFPKGVGTFGVNGLFTTYIQLFIMDTAGIQSSQKKNLKLRPPTKSEKVVKTICRGMVLVLSLLLIVYISYDTFMKIPFLSNHTYMTFQLWVCVAFLLDFFIEFFYARDKKVYLKRRWFFFFISIPYLNLVNATHMSVPSDVLFFLRFIPLVRGAYSLSMVIGYVSTNRAVSLMAQYTAILAALVYCLALIFYYEEYGLNPDVKSFWDALYWSAMNMTTVGCYFSAITATGKVISVILPIAGMLMLPLFTALVTSKIRDYDARQRKLNKEIIALIHDKEKADGKPKE